MLHWSLCCPNALACASFLILSSRVAAVEEDQCVVTGGRNVCGDRRGLEKLPGTLTGVLVADDSMRFHVQQFLPFKARGAMVRKRNWIQLATASHRQNGDLDVYALTMDGAATWYSGWKPEDRSRLRDEGQIHETIFGVTALTKVEGNTSLAMGNGKGEISLWNMGSDYTWSRMFLANGAHHDWERVEKIAVSPNGKLVLGCLADNVVLWQLTSLGRIVEVQHLHGGSYSVAAAAIARLPNDAHVISIAFQSGIVEGWRIDADAAERVLATADGSDGAVDTQRPRTRVPEKKRAPGVHEAWKWQHRKKHIINNVRMAEIGANNGDESGSAVLLLTSADGQVDCWILGPKGVPLALASGADMRDPWWKMKLASHDIPVSALALVTTAPPDDAEGSWQCLAAAGMPNLVVVVDCKSGELVQSFPVSGTPLDLVWS